MSIVVLGSERRTWEIELAYALRGSSPFTPQECYDALDGIDARQAENGQDAGTDALFGRWEAL